MSASGDAQLWLLEAVDQYEKPLTRYASRLLGDVDLAADAVQHAFLALCAESRAHIGDRVAPWLFRVCRNRVVDHIRQAGHEQSLLADSAVCDRGAATTSTPADSGIDPSTAAENSDLATRLHELMRDLPASQRETIDLWCEGFTYREIAAISGRQEGHVRVLAHRGLTSLRQHSLVRQLLADAPTASSTTSREIEP